MNYGELLSELRNNILRDKSSLVAGNQDTLWDDASLLRYIDQACSIMARRTMCLRDDSTPAITQLRLKLGQTEYPMDKRVLAMYSVKFDQDTFDLGRIGHFELNTYMPPDTLWFDINVSATLAPGRPQYVATDESIETLRVYPAPDAENVGKTLYMRVARLQKDEPSLDNLDAVPEFFEEYHMYLLEWAAYRAFSNHDADGGDSGEADRHKKNFEDHIFQVREEVRRRAFAPMNFQFGRLGYAWIR